MNVRKLIASVKGPLRGTCPPTSVRASAMTIIEVVGVLAIIAILAVILVPRAVKEVDRAAWVRETSDLAGISNALVMSILSSKTIPDTSAWPGAVASQMELPASSITTTPRGITRYLLIDPSLSIGGAGLQYSQTVTGAVVQPVGARLMIVSTIATSLKPSDLAAANFTNIWNTPVGQKPSSWTWTGTGDDLRIQRVNLAPLFHRLKLVNQDASIIGEFTIDNSSPPQLVPAGGTGWDSYYLDGTFISLRDTNGVEQARHILIGDISFVFDGGVWRGQINAGPLPNGLSSQYGQQVDDFLATLRNPGAFKGTAQDSVVMVLDLYMAAYTSWANDNPCFTSWGAPAPNQSAYWAMLQQANGSIVNTLDTISGKNGLLK